MVLRKEGMAMEGEEEGREGRVGKGGGCTKKGNEGKGEREGREREGKRSNEGGGEIIRRREKRRGKGEG